MKKPCVQGTVINLNFHVNVIHVKHITTNSTILH